MLTEHGIKVFVFLLILSLYQFHLNTVSAITLTGVSSRIVDASAVELCEFTLVKHNGINKLNGTFKYYGEIHFMEAELRIDLVRPHGKPTRIYDMKVDLCKFVKAKYKTNRLLEMIREGLVQSHSFPRSCPVPPHHLFKVELFDISQMYPHYLPNVTFITTGKVFTRGHLLFEFNLTGFTKDDINSKKFIAQRIKRSSENN